MKKRKAINSKAYTQAQVHEFMGEVYCHYSKSRRYLNDKLRSSALPLSRNKTSRENRLCTCADKSKLVKNTPSQQLLQFWNDSEVMVQ